jgi:hypothetical protein
LRSIDPRRFRAAPNSKFWPEGGIYTPYKEEQDEQDRSAAG